MPKYTIKVADETSLNVMEIRSANGRTAVLFETEDAHANQTPRQTELVFDKIGDRYFLSQIWLSGSDTGPRWQNRKWSSSLRPAA
ncbi:MAG TPA: hypothetical protein VNO70_08270 [Blastocatellia bacterium]|nr:hypothetical protein [Blastocatellia bacterium]